MLNNFIYSKTKDLFLEQLEAGHVLDEAVAFIEDTTEIWNHGTYFDGTNVREYAFPKTGGLITGVSSYPLQLKSSSDIYSTIRFITNNNDYITFGFKNSDNPQLFFTNKNGWDNEYFLYHSGNFNPANYLPLSGGTIEGPSAVVLTVNSSSNEAGIRFSTKGTSRGFVGANEDNTYGVYIYNSAIKYRLGIRNDGTPYYYNTKGNTLLHSGNYVDLIGNTYLKTDGSNTMTNGLQLYTLGSGSINVPLTDGVFIYRGPSTGGVDVGLPDSYTNVLNIGGSNAYSNLQLAWFRSSDELKLYARVGESKGYGAWKEILHAGNYSDLITTLNGGLSIAGGLNVGGITTINSSIASAKLPALGFIPESGMIVGTSTNGLLAYCRQNGQADIQVMRFDGADNEAKRVAYDLNLQPLGGVVNVGKGGLNVEGITSLGDRVRIGGDIDGTSKLSVSGNSVFSGEIHSRDKVFIGTEGLYLTSTGVAWHKDYAFESSLIGFESDKIKLNQRVLIGGAEDNGSGAKLQVKGDLYVEGNIIATKEVSAGGGLSTTEDLLSYGVEWDTTQSTPDCTRIGNPLLHKSLPIQSKLRGCVANGNDINYYLYSEDWAYKEDGTTPSILDGTDGTVRVDTGAKFYIKSGSNGTKRWVRISTIQIDSSWIEVKRMLIDAYRCTVDTTDSSTPKTASVVNTSAEFRGGTNSSSYDSYLSTDVFRTQLGKPRTNLTRATMSTYAKNAGSQLLNYNDYKAVLYWLPVIEFATFNIQQSFNANPTSDGYKQGGLSAGVTNMGSTNWSNYNGYNPITPCGYANSLGNHTGVVTFTTPADSAASVTAVTHSIARWRGFENIFGDIWTNLDGILIEYNATIGKHDVYSCDNSEYFADSLNEHYTKIGEQIASEGYIGEFDLGESAEIIPSSVGGSTTTKKCDYSYQTTSAGLRTLLVGGSASAGGYAGLGCFRSYDGVGLAGAYVGFRTSNYKD